MNKDICIDRTPSCRQIKARARRIAGGKSIHTIRCAGGARNRIGPGGDVMEGRRNLRCQLIQPRVWVSIRLVCELIHDGQDAGKSRRGRRRSGSDEKTVALLNNVTVMPGSRERYIRYITVMLIRGSGISNRDTVTGLPGWCAMH